MFINGCEGKIVELDPAKMAARVEIEELDKLRTDFLPILNRNEYFNYGEGTTVAVLLDADYQAGWILAIVDPEDGARPETGEKLYTKTFPDGSKIKHDGESGELTVEAKGPVKLNSGGPVEITGTGPVKIAGAGSVEIDGGGGATQGVVHAMSPCPGFGFVHGCPSATIKISM